MNKAAATITLAFTGSTLKGAMSAAYDAGIENFRAWSGRAWNGQVWTLTYEVVA